MSAISDCRSQFPALARTVNGLPVAYLDGPGGTQVPQSVIDAMVHYYETSNANTHGAFAASRETDAVIYRARRQMAVLLGAEGPDTISFGANMTSLNFALARAVSRVIQPGDEIVVTDLDHDANVAPWLTLEAQGAVIRRVPVRPDATLDMDVFANLIQPRTRLVAVGYASNAVGTVNDVARIREWTRQVGAWLVVDAVHFVPHAVVDVSSLQPDFLLCSAYKFFGPHVGVLYARPGLLDTLPTDKVRPQRNEAPYRIETGTLNHAALAGVSAAVDFIASLAPDTAGSLRSRLVNAMEAVYAYEHRLSKRLYDGLLQQSGVRVYGPPVAEGLRAPTVSFTVDGAHPDAVARHLAERAISVWSGDFYAVTVVQQLGLAESGGLVRVGFAPYNTEDEVDRTLAAVAEL
ncbi:MAG: cysteine desulfurase-like protein [Alicyclobacillus herbarius]|uniref:cysteine desulfurase-like protein n=1 Tax=Alicyclobacillus herbarius TaxID=122960 RepID=UPI002354AD6A|nr:cysteine desulfurase-like protein [Alicyclobacillus herbarius]MCL6632445.1 cysteine desulfurase-like protein [Alicyclobacillus herbarius]